MKLHFHDPKMHHRLLDDWHVTPPKDLWCYHLIHAFKPELDQSEDRATFIASRPVFLIPKGTVININRIHLSSSHGLGGAAGIRIIVSPDVRLTPKKFGGTYDYGVSFYVPVAYLNELPEVEEVDPVEFKK